MALKYFGENSLKYLIQLIKGKFIAKPSGGAGSATQPVYINSDGVPTSTTYSLGKSVPSDAKFTDTTYSAGAGISLSGTTFKNAGITTVSSDTTNSNGYITYTIGSETAGTSHSLAVFVPKTAAKDVMGEVKTTSEVSAATGYTPTPIIEGVPYYMDSMTYYGTCSTAAATAAKTVSIDGLSLVEGQVPTGTTIRVKFTNANSASNPTLSVNSSSAAYICVYGTTKVGTTSDTNGWYAGAVVALTFDGTSWVRDQGYNSNTTYANYSFGQGYGTCTTAASTAAKAVTLSNYALSTGGIVSVKFTYAVPANATMNINSKGAKNIFYNGAAITADIINDGDVATFIYDGTQYHLISIDRGVSNAPSGFGYGSCSTAAATAAKVATLANYKLTKNGIVSIVFTYAVPANATLNINSAGAKSIFYNGTNIPANIIGAGDVATFFYDGTYYQLLSVGGMSNGMREVKASSTNGKLTIAKGSSAESDITVYTHPSYTSKSSGFYKVTVDSTGHVSGATAVVASDITGLVGTIPTISTNIETDKSSDTKTVSPKAVVSYVSDQLSSTYKPKGTLAPSGIVDALLVKAAEGNVYNISGSFTTTASFVEGAGNVYPAGTNIVVINTGTAASPSYKFDVLSGFVDLSGYATKSDLSSTTYFAELSDSEVKSIWDAQWT